MRGGEQGREGRGHLHAARRRADAAETASGATAFKQWMGWRGKCQRMEKLRPYPSFTLTTPEMGLYGISAMPEEEEQHAGKKE